MVVKVVAARAAVRKVGRLVEAEATEATEATGAMGATEALPAATEQMVVVGGRWPRPSHTLHTPIQRLSGPQSSRG